MEFWDADFTVCVWNVKFSKLIGQQLTLWLKSRTLSSEVSLTKRTLSWWSGYQGSTVDMKRIFIKGNNKIVILNI